MVQMHRNAVPFDDYENVKENMLSYLYHVQRWRPSRLKQFTWPGNWSSYNTVWADWSDANPGIVVNVRYEDLIADTRSELKRLLITSGLDRDPDDGKIEEVVERFSFARLSGRKQGEADPKSFLRKGVAGDWLNYFDVKTGREFANRAGSTLIRLGYEPNDSWVDRLPEKPL